MPLCTVAHLLSTISALMTSHTHASTPPPPATLLQWIVYSPEGTFPCVAGREAYRANILKMGGPVALQQWDELEKAMAPLQQGAALFPAAAIRSDLGVALTAMRFMGPQMALVGLSAGKLTGPFSDVVDKVGGAVCMAALAAWCLRGLPGWCCRHAACMHA